MGVGKTTVGRELARRLGWPLSDSDVEIARRHGATVRELSERVGVEQMHRLEAEHLLAALGPPAPAVVTAAASTIDDPECRRALRAPGVFGVWLRAPAATLAARFLSGPHRPVLEADTAALFARQLIERGARFEAAARATVDVAGRSPADIADEIEAAVRRTGASGAPA
jgi:shikimate kinase